MIMVLVIAAILGTLLLTGVCFGQWGGGPSDDRHGVEAPGP